MSSDESKKEIKMDKQTRSLECEVYGQMFDLWNRSKNINNQKIKKRN